MSTQCVVEIWEVCVLVPIYNQLQPTLNQQPGHSVGVRQCLHAVVDKVKRMGFCFPACRTGLKVSSLHVCQSSSPSSSTSLGLFGLCGIQLEHNLQLLQSLFHP